MEASASTMLGGNLNTYCVVFIARTTIGADRPPCWISGDVLTLRCMRERNLYSDSGNGLSHCLVTKHRSKTESPTGIHINVAASMTDSLCQSNSAYVYKQRLDLIRLEFSK